MAGGAIVFDTYSAIEELNGTGVQEAQAAAHVRRHTWLNEDNFATTGDFRGSKSRLSTAEDR